MCWSASGCSCSWKRKANSCVLRLGQTVVGSGPTSFLPPSKHLLCSAPGSPGRHLPRAPAAPQMTYHIRPGRMESRAIYCCLTGRVTLLNTAAFQKIPFTSAPSAKARFFMLFLCTQRHSKEPITNWNVMFEQLQQHNHKILEGRAKESHSFFWQI